MPQPQDDLVFGFDILKELPINSSEKSTSDPFNIFKDDLSITMLSCVESLVSILLSKEKSYLNPEQPPPFTDILKKVPVGFFDTSRLIFSTAFLLKFISLIIFNWFVII